MPTKSDLLAEEQSAAQPSYADLLAQVAAMRAELDTLKVAAPVIDTECHPDQWDSTGRLISNDRNNAV